MMPPGDYLVSRLLSKFLLWNRKIVEFVDVGLLLTLTVMVNSYSLYPPSSGYVQDCTSCSTKDIVVLL